MKKESKKRKINRVTKREEKTNGIKKKVKRKTRTDKWERGGGKGKPDERRQRSHPTLRSLLSKGHWRTARWPLCVLYWTLNVLSEFLQRPSSFTFKYIKIFRRSVLRWLGQCQNRNLLCTAGHNLKIQSVYSTAHVPFLPSASEKSGLYSWLSSHY